MASRIETYLKDLPVEDASVWMPLVVNFADNREGGKYNVCSLRIKANTDESAFPMSICVETDDQKIHEFQQNVTAVDITIEGGCELDTLLRAFKQILEANEVISLLDR